MAPPPPPPEEPEDRLPGPHDGLFERVSSWFSERDALTEAERAAGLTQYLDEGWAYEDALEAFELERHAVYNWDLDETAERRDGVDAAGDIDLTLNDCTAYSRTVAAAAAGAMLDDAGWYERSADAYPRPGREFDRTVHGPGYVPTGPLVDAVRHLWLARYNPEDPRWADEDGSSTSDVAASGAFGWDDPPTAILSGNYWLSTIATPSNRAGIEQLELGDLVIVQRTAPTSKEGKAAYFDPECGNHDVLYGLAAVWQTESWLDAETFQRETRVALLPLTKFDFPVSRSQLRSRGRLRSDRYRKMAQLLDGTGAPGFTLFPVTDDRDINELLAVTGLHPDVLTEPDLGVIAARSRASVTGDKDLYRLRWDHRYRQLARSAHEQAAVAAAKAWAATQGWVDARSAERIPLAGCDIVFTDPAIPAQPMNAGRGKATPGDPLAQCWTNQVEIEVKGYAAQALEHVHLEASQQQRARTSLARHTPPWWLYAVTGIRTPHESPHTLDAAETVALLDAGGLSARR